MSRRDSESAQMLGSDSFLDVVTNVVGIMVILVMVIGMKSGQSSGQDDTAQRDAAAQGSATAAAETGHDVQRLLETRRQVQFEQARLEDARQRLGTFLALRQQELDQARQQLNGDAQRRYDMERAVSSARSALEQADNERIALAMRSEDVVTVETYPTPISKTVFGPEIHARLCGGRVAVVPLDSLIDKVRDDVQRREPSRDNPRGMVGAVGPIDGFRLRYAMEFTIDRAAGRVSGRLSEFQIVPEAVVLGESIDAALAPNSRFKAKLATSDVHKTTVTLWTYPDSFAEFRTLRKALYEMGYQVAARPLPEGEPIGGSPRGSKSAAQ